MNAISVQRIKDLSCVGIVATLAILATVPIALAATDRVDRDEFWWDGFGPPPGQGIIASGGRVMAFSEYGGRLIVGGDYLPEDGWAPFVRGWNGSTWTALGSGVNGYVGALCTIGTDLYVGGSFNRAGGSPASFVARWDGSAWSAVGAGVDGPISGMTVYGGDLIVAGSFTHAGGVSTPTHAARWDGSNWHAMGTTGSWSQTICLEVVGGVLYAGTTTGPRRWNGSEWVSFGPAFNGPVYSLASYNGALIATGNFYQIGSASIYFIASWDGASWSPLGPGLSWFGSSLCVFGGDLIVAGSFGSPSPYVARWDGTSWHAMGSGVNAYSWAVRQWDDALYVGGEFDQAGGNSSWHIARWMPSAAGVESPALVGDGTIQIILPNPYTTGETIRVYSAGSLRSAVVYDLSGRRVVSLPGRSAGQVAVSDSPWSLQWNGRDEAGTTVPAGVYFLSVHSDREAATRQIVLVK